jgi:hypothetical protein
MTPTIKEADMARKKKSPQVDTSQADRVRAHVLAGLGTPPTLVKVDVFRLHDDSHFRANVHATVRGEHRITHSFYVVAANGEYAAYPPLTKQFHTDAEIDELLRNHRRDAA